MKFKVKKLGKEFLSVEGKGEKFESFDSNELALFKKGVKGPFLPFSGIEGDRIEIEYSTKVLPTLSSFYTSPQEFYVVEDFARSLYGALVACERYDLKFQRIVADPECIFYDKAARCLLFPYAPITPFSCDNGSIKDELIRLCRASSFRCSDDFRKATVLADRLNDSYYLSADECRKILSELSLYGSAGKQSQVKDTFNLSDEEKCIPAAQTSQQPAVTMEQPRVVQKEAPRSQKAPMQEGTRVLGFYDFREEVATSSGYCLQEAGGKTWPLAEGDTFIGRAKGCGIVIPDKTISGVHAVISVRHEKILIEDLKSTNGTWLEGRRIPSNKPIEIVVGTRIGLSTLSFNLIKSSR